MDRCDMTKRFFRAIIVVLTCCSTCVDAFGGEAAETVKRFYSFFNPGENESLDDFRSCFIPEDRPRVINVPPKQQRDRSPVGSVSIIGEEYEGDRCTVTYRLQNRDGIGYYCLVKRDGRWLINTRLSIEKTRRMRKLRK